MNTLKHLFFRALARHHHRRAEYWADRATESHHAWSTADAFRYGEYSVRERARSNHWARRATGGV